jgi:hypothetical protein
VAVAGASGNPVNTSGDTSPDVALSVAQIPTDPDLARVFAAWGVLPPYIRAAVLALVKSANG